MSFKNLSIKQVQVGLQKKEFSCLEITNHYLAWLDKRKEINSFISVFDKQAREQAEVIDQKIQAGDKLSSLAGVPCAIKDNMLIEGAKTTAGSKILENYTAVYTATAVNKLQEAGVVILGKANMDEYAMGSSGENSAYGNTKNPKDFDKIPGGSSSGSAAAVADEQCVFALGSDTGGSWYCRLETNLWAGFSLWFDCYGLKF
jgi:aspartyl-tRNA(Asn)/glutamyl-tRNA(Gln) amidotransferase subunit A